MLKGLFQPIEDNREWIAAIASMITVVAAFLYADFSKIAPTPGLKFLLFIIVCWVVVPPSWFVIEAHFFASDIKDPLEFEKFKYNQDLASKLWIAASLVLGSIVGIKMGV